MIKKLILFILLFLTTGIIHVTAQSFNIEEFKGLFGKGKPLKLSGGISANSVLNAGNLSSGRDPFAYYLNGNVNLNIYGM